MKSVLLLLVTVAVFSACFALPPNSWRTYRDADDDDDDGGDLWRDKFGLTGTGGRYRKSDDDPNNWRGQRSLPFFRYWDKKDKKQPDQDGKINACKFHTCEKWGEDDTGVINCPPDVPKCIPRLGRR